MRESVRISEQLAWDTDETTSHGHLEILHHLCDGLTQEVLRRNHNTPQRYPASSSSPLRCLALMRGHEDSCQKAGHQPWQGHVMEQADDMAMGGSQEKDNKDGRVIKWKMHGQTFRCKEVTALLG
ncbi:Egf-Containing Fibulin-Like Extracellular Matrix Protein 1 [Manis pentadactyla]|nr:Egf-Containing Fibulin-Like Extracellular Matrix Protein 1 [Manis pentadactyla]